MCEALPGDRCSNHAEASKDKADKAYRGQFADGPAVDIQTAARAGAPTRPSPNRWTADTVEDAVAALPRTTTPRPQVDVKQSASALRSDLKTVFGQQFSVKMARGTAYGWVDVSWEDGPRDGAVSRVARGYQDSEFDGMDDSYHQINKDAPVRYSLSGVLTHRDMGPRGQAFVEAQLAKAGIDDIHGRNYDPANPPVNRENAFNYERRVTPQETGRLGLPPVVDAYNPTVGSVARFIHSHTDFTGPEPVFDPNGR